jgi:hypothetical protein
MRAVVSDWDGFQGDLLKSGQFSETRVPRFQAQRAEQTCPARYVKQFTLSDDLKSRTQVAISNRRRAATAATPDVGLYSPPALKL